MKPESTLSTILPVLRTERLLLRALSNADIQPISSLRSDAIVNKYLTRQTKCSVEEAKAFVKKVNDDIANGKSFYWAIGFGVDANLVGTICLWNFSEDQSTAEIGYELLPAFHKQGLMN